MVCFDRAARFSVFRALTNPTPNLVFIARHGSHAMHIPLQWSSLSFCSRIHIFYRVILVFNSQALRKDTLGLLRGNRNIAFFRRTRKKKFIWHGSNTSCHIYQARTLPVRYLDWLAIGVGSETTISAYKANGKHEGTVQSLGEWLRNLQDLRGFLKVRQRFWRSDTYSQDHEFLRYAPKKGSFRKFLKVNLTLGFLDQPCSRKDTFFS